MAIHASERRRNVIRTILMALSVLDLGGAVLVPDGDERGPANDTASWVRLTVLDQAARYSGRLDGAQVTRETLAVAVECYVKGSQFSDVAQIDAVDEVAERVAFALRYAAWPLKDYVSDPTGATAVDGVVIRCLTPPRTVRLPPLDGYQRRMVNVEATLFSRHTG